MDLVPYVLALADKQSLSALKNGRGQQVGLDTLGVDGSTALAVDRRWADDSRADAGGVFLAGLDDDLVHVAMESVSGEVNKFANAFPVVVLLRALDTICFSALVLYGQDTSS